ncbi:MAG: amidohydrolase family protein [Ignavibacteriales bacterium]|nr:amidohydrolase family protein [Ignavibacteriales bacterium]
MPDLVKIIENGYLFTCDGQNRSGQFAVLVRDDRIAEVSTRGDLFKSLHPNAEVIDASGKIIVPGFVDPHVHGESFLLRYFTGGVGMARWNRETSIRTVMEYFRNTASTNDFVSAYRLAYVAALKNGVTTVAEFGFDRFGYPLAASLEALRISELRGVIGLHNGDQLEELSKPRRPKIRFALPISQEEELTTYNLQSTIRSAREHQLPLIAHVGETRGGLETVKKNFRKTIVQLLDEYRVFDLPVHIPHLTALEGGDLDILAGKKVSLMLSPRAMFDKQTDFPPVDELVRRGIPLALASDWGVADPLATMHSFQLLEEVLRIPGIAPSTILSMHTKIAAQAIGMQSEVGSIEAGKKADMAFVDVSDHRLQGVLSLKDSEAILNVLLREALGSCVSDVMIDGQFYLRKGQVLAYAEEDLVHDQNRLLEKLVAISGAGPRANRTAGGQPLPDRWQAGVRTGLAGIAPILPFVMPRVEEEQEPEEESEPQSESADDRVHQQQTKNNAPSHTDKPPHKRITKIFGEDDA